MSCLLHMRAWLVGLALAAACVVSHAQQPSPPQAPLANSPGAPATASGLPADIPLRRETDATAVQSGQWAFALWGLVALAGAAWVFAHRRRPAPAGGKRLGWAAWIKTSGRMDGASPQPSGQTRLTPRHSLHAVQWQGVEYLIGCSDQGMQLIAQRPLNENRPDGATTP